MTETLKTWEVIDGNVLGSVIMKRNTNRTVVFAGDEVVSMSSVEPEKMTMEEYAKQKRVNPKYSILRDGTLLRLWHYDGKWKVSTRNKLDAYDAYWTAFKNGKRLSFGELFEECGGNEMIKDLDPKYTYEVILEHPWNVNVIPAQSKRLTVVAKINNETGEEDVEMVEKVPMPVAIWNDPTTSTELFWNGRRGIMIYAEGMRIQIDHPEFVEAEKLRQNGVMLDRAYLRTLLKEVEGSEERFMRFFPKHAGRFQTIKGRVEMLKRHFEWMKKNGGEYDVDHELYDLWKVTTIEEGELKTDVDVLWRVIKI